MDRLISRIDALRNPTVVGLDPADSMMPCGLREEKTRAFGRTPEAVAQMFIAYNRCIIDAVWDIVPAVKPQIAMYERYGLPGLAAYLDCVAYARERGLLVIGDIKRGDIASTAEAYASHLSGVTIDGQFHDVWQEDAVTLNPYMGSDGIRPFVTAATETGRALFVLLKTSNPSSAELQDLLLQDARPLYEQVASLIGQWGEDSIGAYGYSRVGAVVGATHPEEGARLRTLLPHTFFLVPGYGAQGATAEGLRGFFDAQGRGCIVNSSRGIIAAWQKAGGENLQDVSDAARAAALDMREALREALRKVQ
ncbi:MAG: orotidine-5'-phosphate decarboxylase [Clostridiales Family XIII bacterium]|nr:orotidine-5'-phosphate decarboxylase [Clostridiales Family XIII bacterium]